MTPAKHSVVAGKFEPGCDRMILHSEVLKYQTATAGPFTLDGASLPDGSNSHCEHFCSPDDPFEKAAVRGHKVILNGPWDDRLAVMMEHYCREKAADPYNTSGCFVVPKWRGAPWQKYLAGMQVLCKYPKGSRIFQAINAETGKRELMPGVPWEVLVYWDPPKTRPAPRVHVRLMVLDDDTVTVNSTVSMEVQGKYAGASCTVLLDSGSRELSFVSEAFVARQGLQVKPAPDLIVVSFDGHEVPAKGFVQSGLQLGNMVESTRLFVVPMDESTDIILGSDWLTSHGVVLDYDKAQVTARHGRRRVSVPARRVARASWSSRPRLRAATVRAAALSISKVKRLLRKKAFAFAVHVRQVSPDSANVEFDVKDLLEKPDLHSVSGQGLCDQQLIDGLLANFQDVLREPPPGLPRARGTVHTIPTVEGAKPPYRPPFRLSPAERAEVEKQIKYLLEMGYVRPSTSPYGAPILFVPKPDGTLRFCVDYRMLNAVTVKNRYMVPRTDDLIDALGGAKVFSAVDLAAGYWQIRLAEGEACKTAFTTHFGHFEWRVLPMGLTNAVATFQKLMNEIFGSRGYLNKFVLVYLDDILVFSKTPEEHLEHLRLVLTALREEELYAKPSKCHFNKSELKYLGHVVGADGIKVDPGKIAVVREYPRPQSVGDVRSFLGLATYFRRFIQGFGVLARPLNALTRRACTRAGFAWDESCDASFQGLKDALVTAPVLAMPDYDAAARGVKPFEIVADASVHGIGAVLLQDGHPIAFESRKFNAAAYNYDTGEQELLAIVYAFQKFRCYVEGTEFVLVSDHEPLTYLDRQPRLSRKQARWYEFLRPFAFKWVHRPGRVNVADPLSRAPGVRRIAETRAGAVPLAAVGRCVYRRYLLCAARPVRRSPRLSGPPSAADGVGVLHTQADEARQSAGRRPARSADLERRAATPERSSLPEQLPPPPLEALVAAGYSRDPLFTDDNIADWGLAREGGLLWHGGGDGDSDIDEDDFALAIPDVSGLHQRCLEICHDSPHGGHFGVAKTVHLLKRSYWWPGMLEDAKRHVQSCVKCQSIKPNNHAPQGELSPLAVPSRRWESISLDFIVKLPPTAKGNDAILVIVDRLSKYLLLEPCSETMTSPGLVDTLMKRVVGERGFPAEIVADRDGRVTAHVFKEWMDKHGIRPRLNTAYHSRANGQAERMNLIVENYLRAFVDAQMTDWDELLPVCQLAINNSYHSTVENTPFYLEHGCHPYIPGMTTFKRAGVPSALVSAVRRQWPVKLKDALLRARKAMKVATERNKRHFDSRRKPKEFSVGDRVLLSTKNLNLKGVVCDKLGPRFIGPYTIEEKVGNVSYRLALPDCMLVHPVFHVELLREYKGPDFVPPPAVECEDGTVRWTVETILAKRGQGPRCKMLVRWEGYGPAWDTWEPREMLLEDAPEVVADFDRRQTKTEPRVAKGRSRRRRRKA